jgi:uncharacterized protein (TIGR02996 family)
MPTLEALHEAVLAAPEQEQPRLDYSDAVAVSDPARAEFINLQIDLARWRNAHESPPARLHTSSRAAILREQHGARWAAKINPMVDGWSFLRGFVERVAIDAGTFLATASLIYQTAPVLHLDLTNVKAHAAALFVSPLLARIQSMSLHNNALGDDDIALLAESPHLGALRWLALSNNQITATGIEALAASQRLGSLAYVNLELNPGENPVPEQVDEYGGDTRLAGELQAKFGPRRWMSSANRSEWPPERDAVE